MTRAVISLVGLMLLTGLTVRSAADENLAATPYYPLKVGTRWQYKVGANSIAVKVVKHEKVGDVNCALLETTRDDQVLAAEHIGVKADGIYRYTIGPFKPDPPFRILKLPAKKGDTWQVDTKIGAQEIKGSFSVTEEEVTVPAGKYKALSVVSKGLETPDGNGNMVKLVFKFWFAEKAGMVKQTVQIGDRPEVAIELEKMDLP